MARPGTYHQDYIARIRYSNTLPPPPNPPKLLDIPGTGLGSGQYTSAAYASKLAREQPLNIEADGELGMPIDLIGLPGVFDGNDAAIYGLETAPNPHPHDRLLLRPLNQLGKSSSMTSGVSFLRRTEYISSGQGSRLDNSARSTKQVPKKRKATDAERDEDPVRMLRGIYKGFDTAYPGDAYKGPDAGGRIRGDLVPAEDMAAWERPRHPTNPDLKPLDTYPILPDLEGLNDSGNFWVFKFATNPVATSDTYDARLDVALFTPSEPFPGASVQQEAQEAAHRSDPSLPRPKPMAWNYDMYLAEDASGASAAKRSLDVNNEDNNDPSIYPAENQETGRRHVRFQSHRTYETYVAADFQDDQWNNTIAMALHDEKTSSGAQHRNLPTGAYIYPIVQRVGIRPKRGANAAISQAMEDRRADFLEMAARDPSETEVARRRLHSTNYENDGDVAGEAIDVA